MRQAGDSGHLPPWKSEQKVWAAGSNLEFYDFVPLRGGKGGRVVIDRLIACVQGTLTVATTAWDGRDVPRLLQNIIIEQRDGRQRWNLTGYKSRLMSIKYNGIERHAEHADVAVGASQTIDLRLVIPMAKRFVRRPKDFSLPADVFRKVIVNCAALANAQTSTSVLSAAALNVYILAEWHEEHSVEIKSEDVVKSIDFTSNTQVRASLSGAVHDADIVRETSTAGGGLVSGITDARCDELGIPVLTYNDYKHAYTERRAIAPSFTTTGGERFKDPFRNDQALAIVTATPETSLDDGKVVESMKIDVGTGAANLSLITREVVDKSQSNFNAQAAMFGINPRADLRMKTQGKTKRSFGEWSSDRSKKVFPWSAPLPKAG
jgi:hypothetical protein